LYRLLNTLEIGRHGVTAIPPCNRSDFGSFFLGITTRQLQLNLWKKGISGNKCRDKQKHHCQWRDVHVSLFF